MSAIHEPTAHEPLTETPWDPARAEAGIARIVADAEASLADSVCRTTLSTTTATSTTG